MDIVAIIPLRAASDCKTNGEPRFYLDGQALWNFTIEHALAAEGLREVIVAYDDDKLLDHLSKWEDKVRFWKRPAFLSQSGKTTLDVLAAASDYLTERNESPDYMMLLEITHPLRPVNIISQIMNIIKTRPADSIFTARAVHYNIWRPDSDGLVRVHGGTEAEAIYEEMIGICSLFSPHWLATDTPFGEEVDVAPIDRFWAAIDVRDDDTCWVAEQYIRNLNSTK